MSRFLSNPLLLTAAVAVVAGCAAERPPRSRVQPNVIKKTDMEGSWHYLQTVTDSPPANGSAFVGLSSDLMKIKFDVTEDFLYARRAYEFIEGSEDEKGKDPAGYKGQPLAAWRIRSHFDIIRDFNSTTGEQTNNIIESTERPWQEREFIRVDWSQNLVTDYVGIGLNFFFDDVQVEPSSYWESDPTKPDGLHFERAQADNPAEGFAKGEATYLDLTNQMIVAPEQVTLCFEEGGVKECVGPYPKCLFDSWYPTQDCASQKIKIRHAFAKVGPKHQYKIREWDGLQMEKFGVWDVGLRRMTWNRQYGVTNSGLKRKAARFNVWKETFTADGKEIPIGERTARKIPYYALGTYPVVYGAQDHPLPEGMTDLVYPPYLYDSHKRIVGDWNEAFRAMVASTRGVSCKIDPNTGRALPGECAGIDDVLVPCHSPVRPGDDPVCAEGLDPDRDANGEIVPDMEGNPILHARQGDLRKHYIFWVHQQQNAGPLGYGPGHFDLETGETIGATAYIYGSAVDTYAQRSVDLLKLCNGELSKAEYTAGLNVQDYVGKNRSGITASPVFSDTEVLAASTAMNFDYAKAFSPKNGYASLQFGKAKTFLRSFKDRQDTLYKGFWERQTAEADKGEQGMKRLLNTPIEKMMITPEHMALGNVVPNRKFESLSGLEKARVSPLRWRLMADRYDKDRVKAETIGLDFATFDETGMCQSLGRIKEKYKVDDLAKVEDKLLRDLRKEIYDGVTLHEVGHNVGERHNFRGSYDSMNFFPTYWALRTEGMKHPDPPAAGKETMKPSDGRLHPRYVNIAGGAETKWEKEKAIREYQYSSIMDYGAEFNSDLRGLGLYDRAFIKFSYAERVEVFTNNKTDNDSLGKLGSIQEFQGALGFPSALDAATGLKAIPYQTYPNLFKGGWAGMYERADAKLEDVRTCTVGAGDAQKEYQCDAEGRPVVPYYFCSDEFAGNLTCQRFDSGADIYEQAADIISRYNNFYVMNNFKRDRLSFSTTTAYYSRIADRYFAPLRRALTWYVLLRTSFQEYLTNISRLGYQDPKKIIESENKFFVDENEWGNFTMGVHLGFETLGRVITTPQAGWHIAGEDPRNPNIRVWNQYSDRTEPINDPRIRTVDMLDGKYIDTTWDFDRCGYYAFDECQSRIGYMIDKTAALDVLAESVAQFTGFDTSVDRRRYAIGYVIPYKNQLADKIGAMMSNDSRGYYPWFEANKNSLWSITQPSWAWDNPGLAPKPAADGKLDYVDASTGFTVQIYAGIHALRSYPMTFDHDFIDTTKIFVVGNGEANAPDQQILTDGTADEAQLLSRGGAKEWFVVKDPISGKTFAAHASPPASAMVLDAKGNPRDPLVPYGLATVPLRSDVGVRMLAQLKTYAEAYAATLKLPPSDATRVQAVAFAKNEYEKYRQNVEVMRSLQNAFGYGYYQTDAPFVPPG